MKFDTCRIFWFRHSNIWDLLHLFVIFWFAYRNLPFSMSNLHFVSWLNMIFSNVILQTSKAVSIYRFSFWNCLFIFDQMTEIFCFNWNIKTFINAMQLYSLVTRSRDQIYVHFVYYICPCSIFIPYMLSVNNKKVWCYPCDCLFHLLFSVITSSDN